MSGYKLTESVEADLVEILEYITARNGLDRAPHVHEKFVEAFEALAVSPGWEPESRS